MNLCKNCKRWTCGAQGTDAHAPIRCGNYIPPTLADQIRSMNDEELATYLEEVELAAVRAYGNDDLLLKCELRGWWLKRLRKDAE